jgi:hypothetical protein
MTRRLPFAVLALTAAAALGGLSAAAGAGTATAVAATTRAAPAASAHCPGGAACVAVLENGSVLATYSEAQIEAGDVQDGNQVGYAIRQQNGAICQQSDPIPAGSSLHYLLAQTPGVSLAKQGHVAVTASGVPDINFTTDEVSADGDSDFYDGQIPVVYGNGSSPDLGFIRGLRSNPSPCPPIGPQPGADVNAGVAGDFFDRQEIDVTIYSGPALSVSISPESPTTQVGHDLQLSASVGPQGEASYRYHWDFGDGSALTTRTDRVQHAWSESGSYEVQVTVDGSDGSHGQSGDDRVTVGAPPSGSPTPTPPGDGPSDGAGSPSPGPTNGPTSGKGHRVGAPPGPESTGLAVHGVPRIRASLQVLGTGGHGHAPTVRAGRVVVGRLIGDANDLTVVPSPGQLLAASAPGEHAIAASATSLWRTVAAALVGVDLVLLGIGRELRPRRVGRMRA